jgi:hypothetical protein|tara:strand:- start:421 stop:789 length:369 start_codon:yes stop_codon:yes gene_type:complete
MPNLASEDTVDTANVVLNCTYNAKAIGGDAIDTSVVVENQPLKIIAGNPYVCDDTDEGVPLIPLLPCSPPDRVIQPTVNTTVFIDNKLPAVTGDQTTLVIGGTPRVLTGPFQHANIIIGSNL